MESSTAKQPGLVAPESARHQKVAPESVCEPRRHFIKIARAPQMCRTLEKRRGTIQDNLYTGEFYWIYFYPYALVLTNLVKF